MQGLFPAFKAKRQGREHGLRWNSQSVELTGEAIGDMMIRGDNARLKYLAIFVHILHRRALDRGLEKN